MVQGRCPRNVGVSKKGFSLEMDGTEKMVVMIIYKANDAITETETDLRKTSHV